MGGGADEERRRLAGMLPGAEIEYLPGADPGFIALVRDVDAPIPVLVERGGYSYPAEQARARGSRRLEREPFRLLLVDDPGEFARVVRGG